MPSSTIPYTRLRHGKLYLNYPIPADLRPHFLTGDGKQRDHIVEALGTSDRIDGRRRAKERIAHWEVHFGKLRRGHAGELPSDLKAAEEFREAMTEARAKVDAADAEFIVQDLAEKRAERIESEAGPEAARQWFDMATNPEKMTLRDALAEMQRSPDLTEGTKKKREQQVNELFAFLKVEDCLPSAITEARAVAYVEHLNAGKLGYSTKQDRLSSLQTLWRLLERKRQVPRGQNPWVNHELTGRKKGAAQGGQAGKRAWRDDEVVKLLSAPDDARAKHYTRALFRDLYVLGLTTGMRLDEIVSIRPGAVETIEGGYVVRVEESKTDAGVRDVPVLHAAGVAVLKRRLKAQKDAAESIFPECRPGGPDNKLSWHVQKAMGRDRDALGFGVEVDFHSTRRSFMTMMENSGADVVHVQRYVGHRVPTMMHTVYSDGASRESLLKVARAARYSEKVEGALALAVSQSRQHTQQA